MVLVRKLKSRKIKIQYESKKVKHFSSSIVKWTLEHGGQAKTNMEKYLMDIFTHNTLKILAVLHETEIYLAVD